MICPRVFPFCQRRRIAPHSVAAPFAHRAVLPITTLLSIFLLNGCALQRTSSTRNPTAQNATAQNATAQNATAQSSGSQVSVVTKKAPDAAKSSKSTSPLAAWLSAWKQKPKNASTTPVVVQPKVFIDVAALVQRFPSWQLAERLDKAPSSQSSLVVTTRPFSPRFARIAVPSFPALSPYRVLDAPSVSGAALRTVQNDAARQASDETSLRAAARNRGASGLNDFLSQARVRQAISRRAQENEARATLDDDVAASREVVLPPLEPVGLPSDVQLEITNLRLKLLPNSNTSVVERAAARARLFQLQENWRSKLRAQEQQILDEWTRQSEEEPLRVRREGETQIAAQIQRVNRIDAARLAALRDDQARFLASDFTDKRSLGISLPPFSTYQVRGATLPTFSSANARRSVRFSARLPDDETPISRAPVRRSVQGHAAKNGERARQLRWQALQDARAWARNLARSRGWKLVERMAPGVRDETQNTFQMLR